MVEMLMFLSCLLICVISLASLLSIDPGLDAKARKTDGISITGRRILSSIVGLVGMVTTGLAYFKPWHPDRGPTLSMVLNDLLSGVKICAYCFLLLAFVTGVLVLVGRGGMVEHLERLGVRASEYRILTRIGWRRIGVLLVLLPSAIVVVLLLLRI